MEPGQLVIFKDARKPSFVGDFDTADECVNESLQSPIFNASGINYGYGYTNNDSTNCYAFANDAFAPLAIKKTGSSAQSCLFRGKYQNRLIFEHVNQFTLHFMTIPIGLVE